MPFERVAGQQRAKAQIAAWLTADRLPHAILISGPEGAGKRQLALELAKAVNCLDGDPDSCGGCVACHKIDNLTHADFHTLLPMPPGTGKTDPERIPTLLRETTLSYLAEQTSVSHSNSNIAVDHIRTIQREMAYAPTESRRRIAAIFEADCMQRAGANSLLKILEEPPRHALFLLISAHPDRLLPTVISRCQRLQLRPLSRQELLQRLLEDGFEKRSAELAARVGGGSLLRARHILENDEEFEASRQLVERFLAGGFGGLDGDYWEILDELGPRPDRARVEEFLTMCAVYLRDLFLIAEQRPDDVVHVDRLPLMRQWLAGLDRDTLASMAIELDDAFDHLAHNVNAQLILADLWIDVCRCASVPDSTPGAATR